MPTYTILQRYLYRGNKTWYGRINDGGKISYLSLKTKRKADAQAWLDSKNASRFFPELVAREQKKHDLTTLFNDFVDQKEKTLGSSRSLKLYQCRLDIIKEWNASNNVQYLEDITPALAQKFTNDLCARFTPNVTRLTSSFYGQVVKYILKFKQVDRKNPFEFVEMPKVPKRIKEFWTPEEIDRILDKAQDKAIRLNWAFMAFAGLRRSEARNVKPYDIRGENLRVIGKGNKEALLPISERLAKEIERAGGVLKDGRSEAKQLFMLKAAAKAAGASGKANPHKFRHSFASNLFRAGVGVKHVQELMRHENVEITLNTYGHLINSDLEKAVNNIK